MDAIGRPLVQGVVAAACALAVLRTVPPCADWSARVHAILCMFASYVPGYIDGSERRAAPRRWLPMSVTLRSAMRGLLPSIFDLRPSILEAPEKLAACKQYILCVHPHGVLSLDHYLTIFGYDKNLEQVCPESRRSALSAGVLFKIPCLRELALWTGCVDAGRETASRCLKAGLSISVVPGGEREQLQTQRGKTERLVLRRRQGFVRLALKHGVPLVPAYCFGEAQLYKQSSFLYGLRSWVQKTLGVALVMPYGPGGVPWRPFPEPMCLVVGAPLEVPSVSEPTQEQIDEHHRRYIAEVERLFNSHKDAMGHSDKVLEII